MTATSGAATAASRRVVACIDGSAAADTVVATADGVAAAMDATLDIVSIVASTGVRTPDERSLASVTGLRSRFPGLRLITGPVEQTLVDELSRADVLFGVLGSSSAETTVDRLGHVARHVMTRCRRPLIVVPPGSAPLSGRGDRFLVPFDGRSRTSNAVVPVLAGLIEPMGSIIPVHVFDESAVPMFVSSGADRDVLADEFAARHIGSNATHAERPRLFVGDPLEEIMSAARRERATALVVAWSQTLEPGHARVIRGLLKDAGVPILFHPIETTQDERDETSSP